MRDCINRLSWKNLLDKNRPFRIAFLFLGIAILFCFIPYGNYIVGVEGREGVILADPILSLWGPFQLNWFIFLPTYLTIFAFVMFSLKNPVLFVFASVTTMSVYALRFIGMYLTPLSAPETTIRLADPVIQLYVGRGNAVPTNDLFFSGHTSMLFLIAFLAPALWGKWGRAVVFLIATSVGTLLVLQHVHYSVDIFVAPFMAYGVYRFWSKVFKRLCELL